MSENTNTEISFKNAHLGRGVAIHITDARGILCNRWGTVNGTWVTPRSTDAPATCKRCIKIAAS